MTSLHSPQYKQFVELLVQSRAERGVTQHDLAMRLGKPQSYVSKYERAERRLDVIEFLNIARALDIEASKLITILSFSQEGAKK